MWWEMYSNKFVYFTRCISNHYSLFDMKLIYLEWADATSPCSETWFTEEGAKAWAKNDSYWIEQTGWVVEETKEYLLLAGHKSITKSVKVLVQYGQLFKIPKTWIRKRKVIKL